MPIISHLLATATSFEDLSKTYAAVVTSFQTGALTQLLSDNMNLTVEEFAAAEPVPEPIDPTGGVRASNETGKGVVSRGVFFSRSCCFVTNIMFFFYIRT